MGGEPTVVGEVVVGGVESTELRRGRSASSMDIARDKRPKPTKPASIGKPDTEKKSTIKQIDIAQRDTYIIQCLVRRIALIWLGHQAR